MCLNCHVVVVKTRIKSLMALHRAVKRLGGELHLHKKTYEWYGHWMEDYDQ